MGDKNQSLENSKAKGELINVAARLVQCFALIDLDTICEEQKTVSTNRLQNISDDISDELKKDAIAIKRAIDRL